KQAVPLATAADEGAPMRFDEGGSEGIVAGESRAHGPGVLLPETGAALDIGEEEGDGAGRQVTHQPPPARLGWLRPATWPAPPPPRPPSRRGTAAPPAFPAPPRGRRPRGGGASPSPPPPASMAPSRRAARSPPASHRSRGAPGPGASAATARLSSAARRPALS